MLETVAHETPVKQYARREMNDWLTWKTSITSGKT